jgi:hypothetical protein
LREVIIAEEKKEEKKKNIISHHHSLQSGKGIRKKSMVMFYVNLSSRVLKG